MLKLSIIIPLYNSEKYIAASLDSLLDQDLSKTDYEIIVVNDGSTDNSLTIVEEYTQKHSNIFVFSQINQGASVARNHGIKIANGEFLYFVDSDDYITSNVFKKLIGFLDKEVDLLAFRTIQTTRIDLKKSNLDRLNDFSLQTMSGTDFILKYGYKDAVGWFFVRKQFLISNNLFYMEGEKLEDISFNLELFTTINKLYYVAIDVYRYVHRANSIMTKNDPSHDREIILSYERVVSEFLNKITVYKYQNTEISKNLNWKKNIYHFFLFMRLLRSNLSISEIDKKIMQYKRINLYPLDHYSRGIKVNMMIFLFNNKLLFYSLIKFYRFLNKRFV